MLHPQDGNNVLQVLTQVDQKSQPCTESSCQPEGDILSFSNKNTLPQRNSKTSWCHEGFTRIEVIFYAYSNGTTLFNSPIFTAF